MLSWITIFDGNKNHLLGHAVETKRQYGAEPRTTDTELPEKGHQRYAKDPYESSSKQDDIHQTEMCKSIMRKDVIGRMKSMINTSNLGETIIEPNPFKHIGIEVSNQHQKQELIWDTDSKKWNIPFDKQGKLCKGLHHPLLDLDLMNKHIGVYTRKHVSNADMTLKLVEVCNVQVSADYRYQIRCSPNYIEGKILIIYNCIHKLYISILNVVLIFSF